MRNAIALRCLLVVVFAACTGEVGGTGEPSVTHSDIQMVVAANALSLSVGDAKLVNATVSTTPGRAFTLDFSSSRPSVVSMSPLGLATALADGSATVTVRATLLDGGGSASTTIAVTVASKTVSSLTLAVQGAPTLPFNGTSATVTVGFVGQAPTKVNLSRDGYPAFAMWPTDAFFTLAADQKSLTGQWCISASCWGNVSGDHTLNVTATYADGTTASAALTLSVVDATGGGSGAGTGTAGGTGGGTGTGGGSGTGTGGSAITAAMWAEIATQRAAFGDPNDCKARVDAAVPTGTVLAPGGNLAAALAASSTVVLQTGTYTPTGSLLAIPTGKKLIAGAGQKPVIDLSALTNFAAIYVGDDAVLAGIDIRGAQGMSIVTFDTGKGRYSNGGLFYNLTVHDSGLTGSMDDGTGISISGGSNAGEGQNWCTVAVEIYNSWNPAGVAPVGQGGNSDGLSSKFGAGQNTFIGLNSHNNGDDSVDMWLGGATYHYFGNYHDSGKVPNVTNAGDGNGVKLGKGDVVHKFYKSTATNNKACGYDLNANLQDPLLVSSSATGNPNGDYCYFTP